MKYWAVNDYMFSAVKLHTALHNYGCFVEDTATLRMKRGETLNLRVKLIKPNMFRANKYCSVCNEFTRHRADSKGVYCDTCNEYFARKGKHGGN